MEVRDGTRRKTERKLNGWPSRRMTRHRVGGRRRAGRKLDGWPRQRMTKILEKVQRMIKVEDDGGPRGSWKGDRREAGWMTEAKAEWMTNVKNEGGPTGILTDNRKKSDEWPIGSSTDYWSRGRLTAERKLNARPRWRVVERQGKGLRSMSGKRSQAWIYGQQ